jgi:hypothetical protein
MSNYYEPGTDPASQNTPGRTKAKDSNPYRPYILERQFLRKIKDLYQKRKQK